MVVRCLWLHDAALSLQCATYQQTQGRAERLFNASSSIPETACARTSPTAAVKATATDLPRSRTARAPAALPMTSVPQVPRRAHRSKTPRTTTYPTPSPPLPSQPTSAAYPPIPGLVLPNSQPSFLTAGAASVKASSTAGVEVTKTGSNLFRLAS